MSANIVIRPVVPADAAALAEIYRPFVVETAISFEVDPPSAAEFADRIEKIREGYPWYVGTLDGVPVGYAYGCTHRARAAYRYSVETSVYLDARYHRRGIAGQLYAQLFQALTAQGYCNAYAGITLPNEASEGFHRNWGFNLIGVFPSIGFKFDQWHDVAWYHCRLSQDSEARPTS